MIHPLADQLWHVPHDFKVNGLPLTTRMTIVRLADGGLWLHSPVPLSPMLAQALRHLGPVRHIVAPSKTHHLFLSEAIKAFPDACVYGAPGLAEKRPDVAAMRSLPPSLEAPWAADLEWTLFEGIPYGNETVWFHRPTRTLIVTDLLQWWPGTLAWSAQVYARATGVRDGLAVPRTVRWLVRDLEAVRRSVQRVLAWPFERVVVAHHAVIETDDRTDAHACVRRAFACWTGEAQAGAGSASRAAAS